MVEIKRLGIVISPPKGNEGLYAENRTSEYAAYNAGMAFDGKSVHMLYRFSRNRPADGYDPALMSCYCEDYINYAELMPDGKLVRDFGPVIKPSVPREYAGCHDPRITFLEGKYYITYCAWDLGYLPGGVNKTRLGFASTDDFKTYQKLGVVDLFAFDKDHYFFPERINGKIVLVHRVEPEIQMDFFDSIEGALDQRFWDKYKTNIKNSIKIKRLYDWESLKIGGSVPPIKTDKGWLFIYHGVRWLDERARLFEYCAGAALLDLNDPSKVIGRLPRPLFKPETDYEKFGDVRNVVFPVGGYVYKGELYISYGGADKVVAMCKCNLGELLYELERNKT
ncbi:MAG: hypothetical protein LBL66_04725 [Clostridiales bacterium]|jgi:predicted GH43/DUF377 family glycosyl hydrolase|nr:hypothetical protein [Clostridiales bacterium]